jgi:hypothetical protein
MTTPKLSVEDFYQQFHGHEHHNDPGHYTKPKYHLTDPTKASKHKGLDLKALRNSKRKRPVIVHKKLDTMLLEMSKRKKAK